MCGKEPACQCRRCKGYGFDPCFWKIPWRRKWRPTPVFLPGQFHAQRSLVGYSPRGRRKSLTRLSAHTLWLATLWSFWMFFKVLTEDILHYSCLGRYFFYLITKQRNQNNQRLVLELRILSRPSWNSMLNSVENQHNKMVISSYLKNTLNDITVNGNNHNV